MSPRPSTAHVRRPAILTAAAEVISERGVQNTRISDVAERAGTSAPGVLYWFPSKDALLAEALTFSDDRFYDDLTEELAALGSARDRLTRLVEVWPAEDDGETVLWMELWVRSLRDPQLAATRERLDRPLARDDRGDREGGSGERRVRGGRRRRPGAPAGSADGWVRDPARAGRSRRIDGDGAAALPDSWR